MLLPKAASGKVMKEFAQILFHYGLKIQSQPWEICAMNVSQVRCKVS